MNKRHQHADLIHAYAEGAEIQCRVNDRDDWTDVEYPSWWKNSQYRIRPEVKPDVVGKCRVGLTRDGFFQVQLNEDWPNIIVIFDGETNQLKSVELIRDNNV